MAASHIVSSSPYETQYYCAALRDADRPVTVAAPPRRHGSPVNIENRVGVLPLQQHGEAQDVATPKSDDTVGGGGPELARIIS